MGALFVTDFYFDCYFPVSILGDRGYAAIG